MKRLIKILMTYVQCILLRTRYKQGLYVGFGAKIVGKKKIQYGSNVKFMPYSLVFAHENAKIEIGEGTEVSMFSRIASRKYVKIGKYVLMGPNVFISDYNHNYEDINIPIMHQGDRYDNNNPLVPNIQIGDGSWIGTNSVIVGSVKIGKQCVIGANSVVNIDIPDYCIAVGSPCKIIKRYDQQNNKWTKV